MGRLTHCFSHVRSPLPAGREGKSNARARRRPASRSGPEEGEGKLHGMTWRGYGSIAGGVGGPVGNSCTVQYGTVIVFSFVFPGLGHDMWYER